MPSDTSTMRTILSTFANFDLITAPTVQVKKLEIKIGQIETEFNEKVIPVPEK